MFPQSLENEAIYIMREVAAQFKNPILLFSGGKDSLTLVHLAHKAFFPQPVPFKILHIDTGHNFEETLIFRDKIAADYHLNLVVGYVQDSINSGEVIEEKGKDASRNALQTVTLLKSIEVLKADACIGGARRDEEKARAKERIFSVRNEFGEWDANLQRPELWNLYNGRIHSGENVRVFPLSNWTELDVWAYIQREAIEIPSIYYAHKRKLFYKNGTLMPYSPYVYIEKDEAVFTDMVRFRTVGDMTCTSAIKSHASTIAEIIQEIEQSDISERGARMDDKRSETAMEDRKKTGYF